MTNPSSLEYRPITGEIRLAAIVTAAFLFRNAVVLIALALIAFIALTGT